MGNGSKDVIYVFVWQKKRTLVLSFLLCALHCVLLLPFDLGSLFIVIYLFLGHFSLLLMVVVLQGIGVISRIAVIHALCCLLLNPAVEWC